MKVEHVAAVGNLLGEGPLWHPQEKLLYWVDAFGRMYLTYDPASGRIQRHPVEEFLISLAFRASGGLLLASDSRLAFRGDAEGGLQPVLEAPFEVARVRFNDGRVDPAGRYFVGSMHRAESEPLGALYRLDPDRSLRRLQEGIITSNGLGWSPDCATFYHTDSIRKTIYSYEYDAGGGQIANRRAFVSSQEEPGVPDGLAVDAEGCVWSCRWDGGKIARYDPAGRKMLEVPLPVTRPTSCAFGGEGLDTLYVTSARHGLPEGDLREHPQSGDLFCLRAGVSGQVEALFAG